MRRDKAERELRALYDELDRERRYHQAHADDDQADLDSRELAREIAEQQAGVRRAAVRLGLSLGRNREREF